MAAPGATVRIGSETKAARDFGIRRWFADAGRGRDLVSSSLVMQAGGKAYIRVKPPKYPNVANGITAVAKGVTMRIPQLDEITDIMCLTHTPSVLSIGKRCVTMGYTFFWPPFSEHPFFVKPDGGRQWMLRGTFNISRERRQTMPAQQSNTTDQIPTAKTQTWQTCHAAP
jgi:hypothetical protein